MAQKFKFRLQPVLDQRERIEDEKKREAGARERERLDAENRLRGLQHQITLAKHDLRDRLGGAGPGVELVDVRFQAAASLHLAHEAQKAAIELAGCYQRSEAARLQLLKAMTGRKAVQTLKDRRFEEFKRERSRKEMLQLDDVVSVRSARAQTSRVMEGDAS